MARIFVMRRGKSYRVTLEGSLAAKDLKRLERACHAALAFGQVPLQIDLEKVESTDEAARAYLGRLRARGARVEDGRETRVGDEG